MTARLPWIDIAKGLGILLVVLAHTRFPSKELAWWINSFHMPLFFVLAGMCYDEHRYPSLWRYLKRKMQALTYPYVTLSLLVIGLVLVLYRGNDPAVSPTNLFRNMIHGGTFGAFWFITVLLQVELFYAVLCHWVKAYVVRLILSLSFALVVAYWVPCHLPYFVDTAAVALFFYAAGHFVRPYVAEWISVGKGWCSREGFFKAGFVACAIVLHVGLLLTCYRYKATFASRDLKDPSLYFLLAILGSFSVTAVSVGLDRLTTKRGVVLEKLNAFIRFIGQNTIVVLATHNILGVIRNSWCAPPLQMNGLVSQILEFGLLVVLMWLLSGPMHWMIAWPKFGEKKTHEV